MQLLPSAVFAFHTPPPSSSFSACVDLRFEMRAPGARNNESVVEEVLKASLVGFMLDVSSHVVQPLNKSRRSSTVGSALREVCRHWTIPAADR